MAGNTFFFLEKAQFPLSLEITENVIQTSIECFFWFLFFGHNLNVALYIVLLKFLPIQSSSQGERNFCYG